MAVHGSYTSLIDGPRAMVMITHCWRRATTKVVRPKPEQPDCLTRSDCTVLRTTHAVLKPTRYTNTSIVHTDYIHSLSLTSADIMAYDIEDKVLTLW